MSATRRRSWMAAALVIVLAAFCLPALALAGSQVPFKGSDTGDFSLGGSCGTNAFVVDIDGEGTATHVGRYTYEAHECFNVVTLLYSGTFTLTAANGDRIYGAYSGEVTLTSDPAVALYEQAAALQGGTGRFAGATGELAIDGVARFTSGTGGDYTQNLSGAVSSVGSLNG